MPEKVVPDKVVPEETVWIITDGKAGDLNPCLGVVDHLKLDHVLKTIERDDPGRVRRELAGSVLPSLAIASGRRAIPTLKAVKRASLGRCFTVYLKDPRTIKLPMLGSGAADLIWAPDHDALGGSNALSSLTSPHRLGADVLAAARALPDARVAQLPEPRVAILLGGETPGLPLRCRRASRDSPRSSMQHSIKGTRRRWRPCHAARRRRCARRCACSSTGITAFCSRAMATTPWPRCLPLPIM